MNLEILQPIIHYSGHFLLPGLLSYLFFRDQWKKAWGIMLLTMLIDLDHLWADPIFVADRCSFNFHPLHTYWAMGVYVFFLAFKKARIIGVGLLLHLLVDGIDCLWMC